MCSNCQAFSEQLTFRAPADYIAFAQLLISQVNEGRLILIYGDCALEDLKESSPWPAGDVIVHELQCSYCGQFFQLHVNVWNGRNGWGPQSTEEWEDQKHYY